MKVFISADIEGAADICSFEESRMEISKLYDLACIQMSKETAAACRAALDAGAEGVSVKDAHLHSMNIIHDYLPKEARLIRGDSADPYCMLGGIDKSFDAVVMIGYHDAAGYDGNPMCHTINSRKIQKMTINGEVTTEMHVFTYAAAYLGIPVVMLSGDESICKKTEKFIPNVKTLAAKRGFGAAVDSLHPLMCEEMIYAKVREALEGDYKSCLIKMPENFVVTVSYSSHFDAESNSYYPGAKKINANTISYENKDYYEILRFLHFVI